MALREFKVNEFITLKLEGSETVLYVAGEKFIQCKFLLLIIPPDKVHEAAGIHSIDEIPRFMTDY